VTNTLPQKDNIFPLYVISNHNDHLLGGWFFEGHIWVWGSNPDCHGGKSVQQDQLHSPKLPCHSHTPKQTFIDSQFPASFQKHPCTQMYLMQLSTPQILDVTLNYCSGMVFNYVLWVPICYITKPTLYFLQCSCPTTLKALYNFQTNGKLSLQL